MRSSAYRECEARIAVAVREAVELLDYVETTTPAEVADAATDQLGEFSVYLTPTEFSDLYADVTRYVYLVAELDSGASDGTAIDRTELARRVLPEGGSR